MATAYLATKFSYRDTVSIRNGKNNGKKGGWEEAGGKGGMYKKEGDF